MSSPLSLFLADLVNQYQDTLVVVSDNARSRSDASALTTRASMMPSTECWRDEAKNPRRDPTCHLSVEAQKSTVALATSPWVSNMERLRMQLRRQDYRTNKQHSRIRCTKTNVPLMTGTWIYFIERITRKINTHDGKEYTFSNLETVTWSCSAPVPSWFGRELGLSQSRAVN